MKYPGVIHIHSRHSDGNAEVSNIIKAACKSECNFLIITDHDTLEALPYEGWYDNTILLVGEEITVNEDKGHYLAMKLNNLVNPGQNPQDTIDKVRNQGGIGFIAHPFTASDNSRFHLAPVKWVDWSVEDFDGLEIWNYSHDWIDNFKRYNWITGLLHPDSFINGPVPAALHKWDDLLKYRKVTGLGCVDAHGYFYSYRRMFKTLRTYIILEEPLSFNPHYFNKDKRLIYQALKNGNCYSGYDYLADSSGFSYTADNGQIKVTMGDMINVSSGVSLNIFSPEKSQINLIKDGKLIACKKNTKSMRKHVTGAGVYRVEVYICLNRFKHQVLRPWIFSNPVYIK